MTAEGTAHTGSGHQLLPNAALTRAGPHAAILGNMFGRRLFIRPIASCKSGGGGNNRRDDNDTLEAFHLSALLLKQRRQFFPYIPPLQQDHEAAASQHQTPRAISTAATRRGRTRKT